MRFADLKRLVANGVAAALIIGVAINLAGCSAGGTTYGTGSSTSGGGGGGGNGGNGGGGGGGGATPGTCAVTYTPNYFPLWSKANGYWGHTPIKVYFANGLTVPTPTGTTSYAADVLAGFNKWTTPLNGGVSYTQVTSANGADITINFVSSTTTQNEYGSSYTFQADSTGQFTSMSATFTASSTWTVDPTADLTLVGAETFGQILGVPPSPMASNLTSAYYPPQGSVKTSVSAPSPEDIDTVKTIYCGYY